eukprot:9499866-Pyramimonas_sp.AAC.1
MTPPPTVGIFFALSSKFGKTRPVGSEAEARRILLPSPSSSGTTPEEPGGAFGRDHPLGHRPRPHDRADRAVAARAG